MNVEPITVIVITHIMGVISAGSVLVIQNPGIAMFGLAMVFLSDVSLVVNYWWVNRCINTT